jgi:hypothetical protein
MGTRSLTVICNEDGSEIAVLYRQYDGHPRWHGQELANFLKGRPICNGFLRADVQKRAFNGAGCLAAQIVGHFKMSTDTPIGGFYLHAAGTRDCGEEFIYTVRPTGGGKIRLTCNDIERDVFDGDPADFNGEQIEALSPAPGVQS